jgi:hypothetical protein
MLPSLTSNCYIPVQSCAIYTLNVSSSGYVSVALCKICLNKHWKNEFNVSHTKDCLAYLIIYDTDDGPYQSPGLFPADMWPCETIWWIDKGHAGDGLSPNHWTIILWRDSCKVCCSCAPLSFHLQSRPRKWQTSAWANSICPLLNMQPQPQSLV